MTIITSEARGVAYRVATLIRLIHDPAGNGADVRAEDRLAGALADLVLLCRRLPSGDAPPSSPTMTAAEVISYDMERQRPASEAVHAALLSIETRIAGAVSQVRGPRVNGRPGGAEPNPLIQPLEWALGELAASRPGIEGYSGAWATLDAARGTTEPSEPDPEPHHSEAPGGAEPNRMHRWSHALRAVAGAWRWDSLTCMWSTEVGNVEAVDVASMLADFFADLDKASEGGDAPQDPEQTIRAMVREHGRNQVEEWARDVHPPRDVPQEPSAFTDDEVNFIRGIADKMASSRLPVAETSEVQHLHGLLADARGLMAEMCACVHGELGGDPEGDVPGWDVLWPMLQDAIEQQRVTIEALEAGESNGPRKRYENLSYAARSLLWQVMNGDHDGAYRAKGTAAETEAIEARCAVAGDGLIWVAQEVAHMVPRREASRPPGGAEPGLRAKVEAVLRDIDEFKDGANERAADLKERDPFAHERWSGRAHSALAVANWLRDALRASEGAAPPSEPDPETNPLIEHLAWALHHLDAHRSNYHHVAPAHEHALAEESLRAVIGGTTEPPAPEPHYTDAMHHDPVAGGYVEVKPEPGMSPETTEEPKL